MKFSDVIQDRRSVREFIGEPVTDEEVQEILKVVNRAPSAGNLQAYEIYIVRNKDKKEALVQASHGQEILAEAEVVLVFIADKDRSGVKYGERGEELYCVQDASIAAAYSELAATDLGIGSCWVGAFQNNEVRKILDLKESQEPVALIPIGRYKDLPEKTPRKSLEELTKIVS